ncbi:hypothetical protein B0H17DRAFT_1194511 [Mycena rosella]|uniref:Uncharacterized protein n=1 Tax=Mycena rosella TaxID=1033263 RepID=A0AAD7DZH5_MYCRO|nr:hypothetical protein B0H17DRAFT_1194511 [Mycena rosella]
MARTGQKRPRKHISKSERKNLRLWAEGARESVLIPHLDGYSAALDGGRLTERKYWKHVCKEFHMRVDWKTLDHEEPVLAEWDPAAPVVTEKLPDDQAVLKAEHVSELNRRIRQWFLYRIRRVRKRRTSTGLDPTKDPYAILLAKLSGITAPPKARQLYQQFMRESYTEKIAPVVAEKRDAYIKALKDGPSQTPEACQRCIKGVGDFMGPILQGVFSYTGLHSTLILGGPMPLYGRQLRTTHVLFGQNKTAKADHWPQWDKPRFAANVQNFKGEYLKTAFGGQGISPMQPEQPL